MLRRKGFTLVELMIVIAIIAILATLTLFGVGAAQKSARDTQREQIMNGLRTSLERYSGDKGSYPAAPFISMMNTLTTGGYIGTVTDPGNGAGAQAYVDTATDASKNWLPATGISYSYVAASGTYQLVLSKESGGTLTFKSAQ